MITFEQAIQALDRPEISDLKTTALSQSDVVNLILQRSEIIRDQNNYNRYIKRWTQGNDAPLNELIDQMGADLLIRRAAAFIFCEYQELKPHFETLVPKRIADIGCGYALFDLFLAKDFDSQLYLIDLESNDSRHFGFKDEGAAYSSLESARNLLTTNDIDTNRIVTLNPEKDDVLSISDLDYAFSFISCGFHYPWNTYRKFFEKSLAQHGRVILDFRSFKLADSLPEVSEIGFARIIEKAANNSADRVMIIKDPANGHP